MNIEPVAGEENQYIPYLCKLNILYKYKCIIYNLLIKYN